MNLSWVVHGYPIVSKYNAHRIFPRKCYRGGTVGVFMNKNFAVSIKNTIFATKIKSIKDYGNIS